MKKKTNNTNVLAQNRKASHDYQILSTIEAGIELAGTEIKSVRTGKINIGDGYVQIRNNEATLNNVHISEYKQGNIFNQDPLRKRRLLMHKSEIQRLSKEIEDPGTTIIPLKVYLKHGFAKILLGVAKGKHKYDKRETLKQKELTREMKRSFKLSQLG